MKINFEEVSKGFLVILGYDEQKISSADVSGVANGVANCGVNGGVNGGVNELLNLVLLYPGKRVPFFQIKMDVPIRTIQRWLIVLRNGNKIEFKGPTKTGGYFITEKLK